MEKIFLEIMMEQDIIDYQDRSEMNGLQVFFYFILVLFHLVLFQNSTI